jgi:hypothetical protein
MEQSCLLTTAGLQFERASHLANKFHEGLGLTRAQMAFAEHDINFGIHNHFDKF